MQSSGGNPAGSRATWQDVPDNMKLIVVKELTTWFPYDESVRLLKLSRAEEAGFRVLYEREQRKAADYRAALRAYEDSQAHERELQRYVVMPQRTRELMQGAQTAGGGDPDFDFDSDPGREPSRPQSSLRDAAEDDAAAVHASSFCRPPVADPGLLTDFVSMQQMAVARDFLRGVGFARGSVDLGHWVGHSGGGRFEIDMGANAGAGAGAGGSHVGSCCCEAGHHGQQAPVRAISPRPATAFGALIPSQRSGSTSGRTSGSRGGIADAGSDNVPPKRRRKRTVVLPVSQQQGATTIVVEGMARRSALVPATAGTRGGGRGGGRGGRSRGGGGGGGGIGRGRKPAGRAQEAGISSQPTSTSEAGTGLTAPPELRGLRGGPERGSAAGSDIVTW